MHGVDRYLLILNFTDEELKKQRKNMLKSIYVLKVGQADYGDAAIEFKI